MTAQLVTPGCRHVHSSRTMESRSEWGGGPPNPRWVEREVKTGDG